jgi:hypothetical protein
MPFSLAVRRQIAFLQEIFEKVMEDWPGWWEPLFQSHDCESWSTIAAGGDLISLERLITWLLSSTFTFLLVLKLSVFHGKKWCIPSSVGSLDFEERGI